MGTHPPPEPSSNIRHKTSLSVLEDILETLKKIEEDIRRR